MGHVHRFYIEPEIPQVFEGSEVALSPEEAHHASHVVRVHPGDAVILFDGQGREIDGVVDRLTRREVVIVSRSQRVIPAPAARVTLLQAWLHREKSIEFVIQRGTELGIDRFCFFRSKRSEKKPRANSRWSRMIIEACKQCGRNRLPTYEVFDDLETVLEATQGTLLLLTKDRKPVPLREAVKGNEIRLLVGPEGDFPEEEICLAEKNGAVPISLGTHTYRSEMAATIAAALVLYELGQVGP